MFNINGAKVKYSINYSNSIKSTVAKMESVKEMLKKKKNLLMILENIYINTHRISTAPFAHKFQPDVAAFNDLL